MKQTYSINLGGMVFNIDDDAYQVLKKYLEQIEMHFTDTSERQEIMADIEARIGELFQERNKVPNRAIDLKEVKNVISILGDPDEIGESENGSAPKSKEKYRSSSSRRMYRDPNNRILGGVCSGMGAYWQIDSLVFRIIFVITIFGFVGPIIYLILWIVIPEAKTTAQKLEMRGEPVNISNIGKSVKEEFENIKSRMKL